MVVKYSEKFGEAFKKVNDQVVDGICKPDY